MIASPMIAGARSQNRIPRTNGHGKLTRRRPLSMPRLIRRAASSPVHWKGCGPYQWSVIGEAKNYALALGKIGDPLRRLVEQSPLRDKLVAMIMQAEDAPQAANRIDLDPDLKDVYGRPAVRVTYQNHAFETGARDFYVPKMLAICEAAGAQFGLVAPVDSPSQSRHIMGTLRMGDDPATSVCDRVGKLHDLANVWCADGGLF